MVPDSFRLRSVILQQDDAPEARVAFERARDESSNLLTVVTGKNGVGKSRLLSTIATAFSALGGERPRKGISAVVSFEVNGDSVDAEVDRGRLTYDVRTIKLGSSEAPGPKRVIVTTASAFDKFALPRVLDGHVLDRKMSNYRYLGLKDSRGRISSTAGLYRGLEAIFDSLSEDSYRRSRISDVFADLNYEPRVEVLYDWTSAGRALLEAGAAAGRDASETILRSEEAPSRFDTSWKEIKTEQIDNLESAVVLIAEVVERGMIRLRADFAEAVNTRVEHLRAAQRLRRAGMIRIKSVSLFRIGSGMPIDVQSASSGELSFITTMLGIASSIDDGSLVLVDEPEISLHPELQSQYIGRLRAAFSGFSGCHFIIATHSPLLVAGMGKDSDSIVSLEPMDPLASGDSRALIETSTTEVDAPATSLDAVLLNTFQISGPDNLYIKQTLVRALRLATRGAYEGPEFAELIDILESALAAKDLSPGVRDVIEDLNVAVKRARGEN